MQDCVKIYVWFFLDQTLYSAKEEDLGRGCFSKLVACALFFHKSLKEISHFFNFRGGVRDAIYCHTLQLQFGQKWHYLHLGSKWSIFCLFFIYVPKYVEHTIKVWFCWFTIFKAKSKHIKMSGNDNFYVICNFRWTIYQFPTNSVTCWYGNG